MVADSDSNIAWHRVQLKKNRAELKALETARFTMGEIASSKRNGQTQKSVAELAYGEMITETLPKDELIGEYIQNQLIYYPTVTRDPFRNRGRITDLITSGKLFADIGLPALEAAHDRVMICGSPALVADTRVLLGERGLIEGNHGEPAQFVVEKAFAER